MKRFILALVAVLTLWLGVSHAPASAQFAYPFRPPQYGPYYQTQLSPYLNMLRGGDPAANFYSGVVPEFQRRQDRNAIYSSLQGMSLQIPPPPGPNLPDIDRQLAPAGHGTAFGTTGTYFGSGGMARPFANPFQQQQQQRGGLGQRYQNLWAMPSATGARSASPGR